MANNVVYDAEGWAHTTWLRKPGFSSVFWETLKYFGYTEPPEYVGREYQKHGQLLCDVHVLIPANEACPEWTVHAHAIGYKLEEAWEIAAHKALTQFCEDHKEEIEGTAISVFLINNQDWPAVWARCMYALPDPHQPGHDSDLHNQYDMGRTMHELYLGCIRQERDWIKLAQDDLIAELNQFQQLGQLQGELLDRKLAAERAAISDLNNELAAKRAAISDIKDEIAAKRAAGSIKRDEAAAIGAALSAIKDELAANKAAVSDKKDELAATRAALSEIKNALAAIRAALSDNRDAYLSDNKKMLALLYPYGTTAKRAELLASLSDKKNKLAALLDKEKK